LPATLEDDKQQRQDKHVEVVVMFL